MSEEKTGEMPQPQKGGLKWLAKNKGTLAYGMFVLLAATCWTALRFEYIPQFTPSSYQRIFDFTAAVPFGKRVLMPLLCRLVSWTGVEIIHGFELLEIASVVALCGGLEAVFKIYGGRKMARGLAAGIFAVLPWLFFCPAHWTLLFPWDLPAMAFTAWGTWAVLSGRWKTLCGLMVFASLNRESAIILPMLWTTVWAGRCSWGQTLGVSALLTVIHATCQTIIGTTLVDNIDCYELRLGMSMQVHGTWRLLNNWNWLSECGQRPIVWVGTMAGLPLAFLCCVRCCGVALRRLGFVAWVYFWMLMVVGNIYEARVYGEISVLLYIPVALCVWERTTGEKVLPCVRKEYQDKGLTGWECLELIGLIGVACAVVLLGWGFAHGWDK